MIWQAVLERQGGERRRWKEEMEKSRMEMEHQVDIKVTMVEIQKYADTNADKILKKKTRADVVKHQVDTNVTMIKMQK